MTYLSSQLQQTTAKLVHVRHRITVLLTTLDLPASNDGASGSSSAGIGESDVTEGGGAREYLLAEAQSVLSDLADALALVDEVQSAHALRGSAGAETRRGAGVCTDGMEQTRKYTYEELEDKLVELKDALFLEQEWNKRREAAFNDFKAQQDQLAHPRAAGAPGIAGTGVAKKGGVVPSLARDMHKVSKFDGQGPGSVATRDAASRLSTCSAVTAESSAEYDETTDLETHQDLSQAEGDDESPLPRLSRNSPQTARLSVSFGPLGKPLAEDSSSVEELQRELAAVRRALEEETKLSEWYASQLDEANRQVCLSSHLCLSAGHHDC
jgi:hypothetical protein